MQFMVNTTSTVGQIHKYHILGPKRAPLCGIGSRLDPKTTKTVDKLPPDGLICRKCRRLASQRLLKPSTHTVEAQGQTLYNRPVLAEQADPDQMSLFTVQLGPEGSKLYAIGFKAAGRSWYFASQHERQQNLQQITKN